MQCKACESLKNRNLLEVNEVFQGKRNAAVRILVIHILVVGLVQKIIIRILLHVQLAHLLVDDIL